MRVNFSDIFYLKNINDAYLRHVNSGIVMSWEDEIKKMEQYNKMNDEYTSSQKYNTKTMVENVIF